MTILIADDEEPARQKMLHLLKNVSGIEQVLEASNGSEALRLLNTEDIDIAFLDINMPGLTGLEVVAKTENECAKVFTTAYSEHALEAFNKNVTDYLLKPVNQERLQQCFDKILKRNRIIEPNTNTFKQQTELKAASDKIALPEGDRFRLIPYTEISLIHVDGRYCTFHASGKQYSVIQTLEHYESKLPGFFFRASRSDLVNLNMVKEVVIWFTGRYKLKLSSGEEVLVSRERSRVLRDMLGISG